MKTSHVILKVEDLDAAVREYRERGFAVEYGRAKNPINALIYFSKGPFIELLDGTGLPAPLKALMRILGKNALFKRFGRLDSCAPGYCELALESYGKDLKEEKALLARHGIKCSEMPGRRVDTQGRDLRFRVAAPEALDLPFFMTYFSVDPKPVDFIHPNGIREVGRVVYGTDPGRFALIRALCDDERLELVAGEGISVEFRR